jgi:hypothetical protein
LWGGRGPKGKSVFTNFNLQLQLATSTCKCEGEGEWRAGGGGKGGEYVCEGCAKKSMTVSGREGREREKTWRGGDTSRALATGGDRREKRDVRHVHRPDDRPMGAEIFQGGAGVFEWAGIMGSGG